MLQEEGMRFFSFCFVFSVSGYYPKYKFINICQKCIKYTQYFTKSEDYYSFFTKKYKNHPIPDDFVTFSVLFEPFLRIMRILALPQFEMELGLSVDGIDGSEHISHIDLVICLYGNIA